MEYPPKLRHGLPHRNNPPIPHQHRLLRSPQRNRLPNNHVVNVRIHPLNRMHPIEAPPEGTSPPSTLVPWPLRDGYQHCRHGLPPADFCIRLLPSDFYGGRANHELECCYVPRADCAGVCILRGSGAASFRAPSGIG